MPRPMAFSTIAQHVMAQFQPQFNNKGVALITSLPPDLPDIVADPDRLEQILINLLSNALRYTPTQGSVTIAAEAHDFFVQISVRDTGIGIPAEHLPQIFERFYRVDKSRARQSGGTGIGLTITRHLVYAQGGEIWADSAGAGQGSTFFITLPVHDTVAAAA